MGVLTLLSFVRTRPGVVGVYRPEEGDFLISNTSTCIHWPPYVYASQFDLFIA